VLFFQKKIDRFRNRVILGVIYYHLEDCLKLTDVFTYQVWTVYSCKLCKNVELKLRSRVTHPGQTIINTSKSFFKCVKLHCSFFFYSIIVTVIDTHTVISVLLFYHYNL